MNSSHKRPPLYDVLVQLAGSDLEVGQRLQTLDSKCPLFAFEAARTQLRPSLLRLAGIEVATKLVNQAVNRTVSELLGRKPSAGGFAKITDVDPSVVPDFYQGLVLVKPASESFPLGVEALQALYHAEYGQFVRLHTKVLYASPDRARQYKLLYDCHNGRSESLNSAQIITSVYFAIESLAPSVAASWELTPPPATAEQQQAEYEGDARIVLAGQRWVVCCPWLPKYPSKSQTLQFFNTFCGRMSDRSVLMVFPFGGRQARKQLSAEQFGSLQTLPEWLQRVGR